MSKLKFVMKLHCLTEFLYTYGLSNARMQFRKTKQGKKKKISPHPISPDWSMVNLVKHLFLLTHLIVLFIKERDFQWLLWTE